MGHVVYRNSGGRIMRLVRDESLMALGLGLAWSAAMFLVSYLMVL